MGGGSRGYPAGVEQREFYSREKVSRFLQEGSDGGRQLYPVACLENEKKDSEMRLTRAGYVKACCWGE